MGHSGQRCGLFFRGKSDAVPCGQLGLVTGNTEVYHGRGEDRFVVRSDSYLGESGKQLDPW